MPRSVYLILRMHARKTPTEFSGGILLDCSIVCLALVRLSNMYFILPGRRNDGQTACVCKQENILCPSA